MPMGYIKTNKTIAAELKVILLTFGPAFMVGHDSRVQNSSSAP
jgi:hypothetical protein